MVGKPKDEFLEQVTSLLTQLRSRIDKIASQSGVIENAAKVYADQLLLSIKLLEDKTKHKATHASNQILRRYDNLMATILRPKLPIKYRGAPAYHLRKYYAAFADIALKLTKLRQQLRDKAESDQPQSNKFSEHQGASKEKHNRNANIEYFPMPQGHLIDSLWGGWLRRRLVMPFLVAWDGFSRAGNYLLGAFFMRNSILPALSVVDWRSQLHKNYKVFEGGFEEGFDWDETMRERLPQGIEMKRFHLVGEASAIACVCLSPEGMSVTDPKLKTVVYFLGNLNICYASFSVYLDDMISVAEEGVKCRFIFWHYPGVLNSFGFPKKPVDLVRCGLSVVQHVMNEGARAENLILKGHSLGGYVATHVAYCCHRMSLWVKLWNDRSFSDSPEYLVACAVTRGGSGYRLRNLFWRFVVYACYPLAWLTTRIVRCEVPSSYFFTKLKRSCIDYIVVRSTPEVRAKGEVFDDVIIQDSASLDTNWWFRFCGWWRQNINRSDHHYHMPDDLGEDAHQAPLKKLLPSFGIAKRNARKGKQETAQKRFARFVAQGSGHKEKSA